MTSDKTHPLMHSWVFWKNSSVKTGKDWDVCPISSVDPIHTAESFFE